MTIVTEEKKIIRNYMMRTLNKRLLKNKIISLML